jgi:hypothetical protein
MMFVLALERLRIDRSRTNWFEAQVSGGHGGGVIPVPIPNTAVKPTCADGTWGSPPGRVGRRRIFLKTPTARWGFSLWWPAVLQRSRGRRYQWSRAALSADAKAAFAMACSAPVAAVVYFTTENRSPVPR